jgi:hypothetical protein
MRCDLTDEEYALIEQFLPPERSNSRLSPEGSEGIGDCAVERLMAWNTPKPTPTTLADLRGVTPGRATQRVIAGEIVRTTRESG